MERVPGISMKRIFVMGVVLSGLFLPCSGQQMAESNFPRLPGAELLVKSYYQDKFMLLLTSEDKIVTLQEDAISLEGRPGISADGSVLASAHRVPGDLSRYPRLIASTYSMKKRKWTDYPELEGNRLTVAISPDGSQLACISRNTRVPALELRNSPPRLQLLNLKTREVTAITTAPEWAGFHLSWSPDGRHLAFDMTAPGGRPSGTYAIYVLDVNTGDMSQIGLGVSPSWSPSGEWIAFASYVPSADGQSDPRNCWLYNGHYYSYSAHQFSLMSSVGTHTRVLMKFHSGVEDDAAPVWSPDSKTLLLTRVNDPDNGTRDIYELTLATSHRAKKFPNTVSEVYGWIDAPAANAH